MSNDIGRDEDDSDVSRSSDEDMDPVESTSCKDPGGIRDEVMNSRLSNDASQHHPTEQGSVQTVENNKRKAEEDVSIPDEVKLRFRKTPLTNVSVIWEAHLKDRQKRPIRGKRRGGKGEEKHNKH